MRVGILVPSVYMYKGAFEKRISAPMALAFVLADSLVKKGIEVKFFSAPNLPTKAEVVSVDTSLLDQNLHIDYQQDMQPEAYEAVSLYETKKYFELDVTEKAYKMAKNGEVDIIHVYHAFGNLAHYFVETMNVPTVFTLHVLPPPVDTLDHWRYKRFQNQNFIGISNSQKHDFQATIPEMNIMDIIYHGVDLEEFAFNEKPDDYFAFMGRLIPQKGLDVAMKIATEMGVNLKVATHITPVTEKSEYYQKEIAPFMHNQNIEVFNLITGAKRVDFLQQARAFLFPLQWNEPFGMVMIEAMSCGTPVIAYNRGSVSELVKDGVTGFIVDPDDEDRPGKGSWVIKKQGVEGLMEAMSRVTEIKREDCRRHVEEKFSVEMMTNNYITLYKKVLENPQKA
jgi:glycosyltransferase involved in cell wall biosynthesis